MNIWINLGFPMLKFVGLSLFEELKLTKNENWIKYLLLQQWKKVHAQVIKQVLL